MGTKKKRDGWFFNKSIIDEINQVPDQVAAEVPDELVEVVTKPTSPETEPVIRKQDSEERSTADIQQQLQLLKAKIAEMEQIAQELQQTKQELASLKDVKAERDQLRKQLQASERSRDEVQEQLTLLKKSNEEQNAADEATSLSPAAVSELLASLVQEKQKSVQMMARIQKLEIQNQALSEELSRNGISY